MNRNASDENEDDGFDDFLSEDEEECALQTQEMEALARKMKTVGVREAIDHAKESALQQGFDEGFASAAQAAFGFSALRGALSVALISNSGASGSGSEMALEEKDQLVACIDELRVRSLRVPQVEMTKPATLVAKQTQATPAATVGEEKANDGEEQEDAQLIARASQWLQRLLGVDDVATTTLLAGHA